MTWNHYNAELVDINGRRSYARIECDKHMPQIISARIGYMERGICGFDVMSHAEPNTSEGEAKLVKRIKAWASSHGMKIVEEEFTEFTNIKQKE